MKETKQILKEKLKTAEEEEVAEHFSAAPFLFPNVFVGSSGYLGRIRLDHRRLRFLGPVVAVICRLLSNKGSIG